MSLTGVFNPVFTPVTARGDIDYDAWQAHIDRIAGSGINGILIFGSIGEFFSFSPSAKAEAVAFVSKVIAGRCSLFVGVTDLVRDETARLVTVCERENVDALVVLSPYYFASSDEAILAHFGSIASSTELPIMAYNFPDRTGNDLHPELLATLAEKHRNIVALKDTVDSASHTRAVISAVRSVNPEFSVFSGFDEYYMTNRIAGGNGVLSGLTNVIPEVFVAMHGAFEAKRFDESLAHAATISRLMELYSHGDDFVSTIKVAAAYAGKLTLTPVLNGTTVEADSETVKKIHGLVDAAYNKFSDDQGVFQS